MSYNNIPPEIMQQAKTMVEQGMPAGFQFEEKKKRLPLYDRRVGDVQLVVWPDKNGTPVTYLEVRYKVRATGEWKSAKGFYEKHLPVVMQLITDAWQWLLAHPQPKKPRDNAAN